MPDRAPRAAPRSRPSRSRSVRPQGRALPRLAPVAIFPRATTERLLRRLRGHAYFLMADLIWRLAGETTPVEADQQLARRWR